MAAYAGLTLPYFNMDKRNKIEKTDVFIFLGLVLTGTGLFFWFGHGIALTVVGILLLGIGFFGGAIRDKK